MRRLYTQLYLHFVGVLIVVGIATFLVVAAGWRGAFFKWWAQRLAEHAGEMIDEQADDAARGRMVRHLAEAFDVDIAVREGERVVVAAGGELPALSAEDAERARAGPIVGGQRRQWTVAAPVGHGAGGRAPRIVQLSMSRRSRSPSMVRHAALAVLVLLIVGLATAPLARRISRPVERLTEAARRIGAGELGYRVPLRDPRRRRAHRHRRSDELTELTRAFNEMAERIEGLVRTQKELLANVSHELRSPLARIRVALELLPRDGDGPARIADLETDIEELDRLIDDVLTMSRLDSAGLPSHPGPVELRGLLGQLLERAARDPALAGRAVTVEGGPPVEAVADAGLLKRALWNLIENAARYGAPPITLQASVSDDAIVISVSDRGGGIPAADRERVFQPFFRSRRDEPSTDGDRAGAGPAGSTGRGYGLGLALARRVALAHGGSIRAEPAQVDGAVEQGCRIVLTLPRARAI